LHAFFVLITTGVYVLLTEGKRVVKNFIMVDYNQIYRLDRWPILPQ